MGRDEGQERRGNGADVEKSDERRAPALEPPPELLSCKERGRYSYGNIEELCGKDFR